MTVERFDPNAPAQIIFDAWRNGQLMDSLPVDIRPENLNQGYEVQEQLFRLAGGDRAGWKLGVGSPAGLRCSSVAETQRGLMDVRIPSGMRRRMLKC